MESSPKGGQSDESPEQPETCAYPPLDTVGGNRPPSAQDVFFGLFSRPESEIFSRFKDSVSYRFQRMPRGYCVATFTSAGRVDRTSFGVAHFRDVFRPLFADRPDFPPASGLPGEAIDFDLSRVSFGTVSGIMREVEGAKRIGGREEVDPGVAPDVEARQFAGQQISPRPSPFGSSLFWSMAENAAGLDRSPSSVYSDLCAGLENLCSVGFGRPSSAPAGIATTSLAQHSPNPYDFVPRRGSPAVTRRPAVDGPAFGVQRQMDSLPGGSSVPHSPVPFFVQFGPPSVVAPPGMDAQNNRVEAASEPRGQPLPHFEPHFPIGHFQSGRATASGGFARHSSPSPGSTRGSPNNNLRLDCAGLVFPQTPVDTSKTRSFDGGRGRREKYRHRKLW